jgi:RNA-directed DNA polymerase
MLNSKIRGWGGYYQHGATRDSFHRIDHQIFLSLWQWAKRRHSKKGKRWIKDRYWHDIRGNKWTFASKFKKPNGKEDQLTLLSLTSSFPFLQYTQIKGDMNPFDADCRLYFYKRKKSKMLVTLKGRKSLLYLWEKQGRKCPICGEPIRPITERHSLSLLSYTCTSFSIHYFQLTCLLSDRRCTGLPCST